MYRWIPQTAELELEVEAPTEFAVFADALAAFAELVGDGDGGSATVEREIELGGSGLGDLLADWLDELVYLADVEGFIPQRLARLDLGDGRLSSTVSGYTGESRPLVKAVTRHGLRFEAAENGGWHARVVLDV
jgi:SHS2 domain-containing protein